MKKFVALLSACLMIALTMSGAFAATLDVSYAVNNSDIYVVEPSEDGNYVFVETVLTASDRHFTHKYESNYFWSTTQFDILGVGYSSDDAYPVWRVWIVLANEIGFMNIDSATFVVNGQSYTFTGIGDPENWQNTNVNDDGSVSYLEEMLIKFGMDNLEFVVGLEQYCNSLDSVDDFHATLTLHAANEDITVELGSGFALDFVLTKQAYLEMDGLSTIDRVGATPVTIK